MHRLDWGNQVRHVRPDKEQRLGTVYWWLGKLSEVFVFLLTTWQLDKCVQRQPVPLW